MDIWTAVRTVLLNYPGAKAEYLIQKVREKTKLGRSTIYYHLSSFELKKKIYRKKGRYWLEKPRPPNKDKLERIKGEMEKIKEDFVSRRIQKAYDRVITLHLTMLPQDWKDELQPLIISASQEMLPLDDKLRSYRTVRTGKLKKEIEKLRIAVIVKVLRRLGQLVANTD